MPTAAMTRELATEARGEMTVEQRRDEMVKGLRALADLIEGWPVDVLEEANWPASYDNENIVIHCDKHEHLSKLTRLVGRVEKYGDAWSYGVRRQITPMVELMLQTYHSDDVCEKVVVGTTMETRRAIPADREDEAQALRARLDALETDVEVPVEQVEWRCPPLLANGDDS